MASYTFPSNAEGWDTSDFTWTNAAGSPGLGCLQSLEEVTSVSTSRSVSFSVSDGDPFSFRVRITATSGDLGVVQCYLLAGASTLNREVEITALPFDSGWLAPSGSMSTTETVDTLTLQATAADGILFQASFDSVYVAETPPGGQGYGVSTGGVPGAVLV